VTNPLEGLIVAELAILRFLWYPKVQCSVDKGPPPDPILSPKSPVRSLPPYCHKICFNIALSSAPRSPEWSLPFRHSVRNFVRICRLPHACYMPCPLLPWFEHRSDIWRAPFCTFLQRCTHSETHLTSGAYCKVTATALAHFPKMKVDF
jgi:hypothetical protein